jgi:hypothetical protein
MSSAVPIDWRHATFEEVREVQRQEFPSLSFRAKLERLEQMGELIAGPWPLYPPQLGRARKCLLRPIRVGWPNPSR